jgi:hypothetical protein
MLLNASHAGGQQVSLGLVTQFLLLLLLAHCASPYDPATDKSIADLRKKVDDKILALISDDQKIARLGSRQDKASQKLVAEAKENASFEKNRGFYNEVDSDLTGLQMRIDGTPDLSTQKVDSLIKDMRLILLDPPPRGQDPTSMQAVHEAQDRLGASFLRSTRAQVDVLFATLVKYELTLQSGTSSK